MERESRFVKVASIAYHLAKQVLPKYSHPKSPHHFEFPQLAACVLLMFYLDCSYRDMEEPKALPSAAGWSLWTTLEVGDGDLGDQAQVW